MFLFCCIALALAPSLGDPLTGLWSGEIQTPRGGLETSFQIEADPSGSYRGSADTPAQGIFGLPLSEVSLDGRRVVLSMAHARYEAELSADGNTLDGVWIQNGAETEFDCTRDPLPAPPTPDLRRALVGAYEGTLEVGAVRLRLFVALEEDAGRLAGHLKSPDQTDTAYPITRVDALGARELRLAVPSLGTSLQLRLTDDPTTPALEGRFRQGVQDLPIVLQRVEAATLVRRPQTPEPPFPYRAVDVRYPNQAAGIEIAGTLTLPAEGGPFPAALLITGSGAQDRNESLFQHEPFWVLADHLTRAGIAVLRADDRGVGGTTQDADPSDDTTLDFAGDVAAGVAFLRNHDAIDGERVGLIGHSEGGLIAPLVARDTGHVAFQVLLAGPGLPGRELLAMQVRALGEASGQGPAQLEQTLATQRELFDLALDDGLEATERRRRMRAVLARGDDPEAGAQTLSAMAQLESAWLLWFLAHDPRPALEATACPTLALFGGKDLQVPAQENQAAMRAAFERGGVQDVTLHTFPAMNHLFQRCETGLVEEYGQIEETFAPAALAYLADWISVRCDAED